MIKKLILLSALFYGQVSAQTNFNESFKNTNWKLDFYSINDSQALNTTERFYIFKDSLYLWLETQKIFTDVDKDTSLLSMGLWHVDTNNLLIMHQHYMLGFWYETPLRSNAIKLDSVMPDTVIGMPLIQPHLKIHLVKVNQLNYAIPSYQLVQNPNNGYQFAYQSYVKLPKQKLLIKSGNGKKQQLVDEHTYMNIDLQDTYNQTNTSIYGTFFTCDRLNLYIKVNSKYLNTYQDNGISTHYQTYLPEQPDTASYPYLGVQLFEAIPYSTISRISAHPKHDMESVFITIFTASLVSSLVVAPAISYNYKTGNFNQNRYYKILIPSLITLGCTIPLYRLYDSISHPSFSKNKDHFSFENIEP